MSEEKIKSQPIKEEKDVPKVIASYKQQPNEPLQAVDANKEVPNDPNIFSLTKERLIELGFEEINGLLWYEWFPFGLAYIDDEESPVFGEDEPLEPYWGVWCANCLLGLRLRTEAHLRDLFIAHRVVPPKCAQWQQSPSVESIVGFVLEWVASNVGIIWDREDILDPMPDTDGILNMKADIIKELKK